MDRKIAILRGINVGGNRKILMADLKSMFETLGVSNITTYIQSGNVIFESHAENRKLEDQIEKSIKEKFGFDVPVMVRTSKELNKLIKSNPFFTENSDINNLHLTFLKDIPTADNKQQTEAYNYEPDKFAIEGKEVFIFCEGKYHESKLTNNFFEKKLNVRTTTRNWKTILKLIDLAAPIN